MPLCRIAMCAIGAASYAREGVKAPTPGTCFQLVLVLIQQTACVAAACVCARCDLLRDGGAWHAHIGCATGAVPGLGLIGSAALLRLNSAMLLLQDHP